MSLADSRPAFPLSAAGMYPAVLGALRGWRRAGASFGFGALSVLGFAPFQLWPLLFLTLPSFVWLLDGVAAQFGADERRARAWRAGVTGWWFGFGFFIGGLYWIGIAFLVEADKFAWLIPFAMTILPSGLALFYGVAAAGAMLVWRPGASRIFPLVAALFAVEWLRWHILTGFPWNLWGYALAGSDALMQTTALFGIYGLTFIALLAFASPAVLAGPLSKRGPRRWVLPVLCVALLGAGWAWGALRLASATEAADPQVRLRIVQGNIPQAEKWKPENREWIFKRLLDLSAAAPPQAGTRAVTHLIWPETSVPFLFVLNGAIASAETRETFARLIPDGANLILGAERVEATKRSDGQYVIDRVYNSLFVLNAEADITGVYDKQHLVPFGEYVPFEDTLALLGIKQLTHLNTGFASGLSREALQAGMAPLFSPLICYEAIFPGRAAGNGARPGWLLNLTNDAWFGTSTGPYQHLQKAQVRAVEEGLPLVRAANTGISAVVDSYGRIKAALPLNQAGFIDEALPVALAPTPFSTYREISLILVALVILLLYRIVITVE